LTAALKALDTQIAREMQRSPAQTELHGVQKWEPYRRRMEELSSFLIDNFGQKTIGLDGLLVLSETLAKSLQLLVEDLGPDGLGRVRSEYCSQTVKNIMRDCEAALAALREEHTVM
jgi:hypothetical protein